MKNFNIRFIFSAVGMALSIAVLVLLIISDSPDIKMMVMLLALGMAAQGIAMCDQIGEKVENKPEDDKDPEMNQDTK